MKHSDEQIIATIRKILDTLHDPNNGFNAFRNELRKQQLTKQEYEQRIVDKEYEIAAKYGMTKQNGRDEIKFRLSGQDVMDNHLYVSCGQAAKAFCYVNSQLPKDEQLNLKVLFSTDIEHLIDAKEGHTLPCVKLSDGKWHAIEPQIKPNKEYPGFNFVCDDVKAGGEIWHLLESIKKKGRPYLITKIVTPQEQLDTYSDFGKFLQASMVHKGKMALICSALKVILRNIKPEQYKNDGAQLIYKICKALKEKELPIKVLSFINNGKFSYIIAIEADNAYYDINPTVQYLSLIKCKTPDNFKFNEPGYKLQKIMSPKDYITEYESYIMKRESKQK